MMLTYMFALCLRVDDYATDTTLLAMDLAMAATKCVSILCRLTFSCSFPCLRVDPLFKSLGPSNIHVIHGHILTVMQVAKWEYLALRNSNVSAFPTVRRSRSEPYSEFPWSSLKRGSSARVGEAPGMLYIPRTCATSNHPTKAHRCCAAFNVSTSLRHRYHP